MQAELETMKNEETAQRSGDQGPGWYATRAWHCRDGELTCVRVYMPYERSEGPEHLNRDV